MAKSDFERTTDQIRDQLEDLRSGLDDILHNYNKLASSGSEWLSHAQRNVARAARQATGQVEKPRGGIFGTGISWWVPVAAIAVIGMAIAMIRMFTAQPGEQIPREFTQNTAGLTPPYEMPGQP